MRRKEPLQQSTTTMNIRIPNSSSQSGIVNSKSLTPYVSSTHNISSTNECEYLIEDQEVQQLKHMVHELEEQIVIKDQQSKQKDARIERLVYELSTQNDTLNELRESVNRLSTLVEQNEFLSKNNKNLYRSTMRLNEENHKLTTENDRLSKQILQMQETIKKLQEKSSVMKKSHKDLLKEQKNMISQNLRDVKELQCIKTQFQFQKEALISHIKYLQRVPKTIIEKSSVGMLSETRNSSKKTKNNIQNSNMNVNMNMNMYSIGQESSTLPLPMKKRRGLSCL